jgi:hypothetical protein
VTLQSVQYFGAGDFFISKKNANWTTDKFGDEGGTVINYPEWQLGPPAVNEPAGYVRGSTPNMTAVLGINPPQNPGVNATLHVKGTGGLAANVDFTKNVTLQGGQITVQDLTWNVALPNKVRNDTAPLTWEISINGGANVNIGNTATRFFVTYAPPAGYYANPAVTAVRLNRVTQKADNMDNMTDIAKTMRDAVAADVGFNLHKYYNDRTGNHWAALDPPVTRSDCISLAVLTAKHLRMLGITATERRAYPTGGLRTARNNDTNTTRSEFTFVGILKLRLGFEAGGFNAFEGYFEITDGARKAFTVAPALGPILETNLNVQGDKLSYNVIKTTLENGNLKQYWYMVDPNTGRMVPFNNIPIPFPVP